MYPIIPLIGWNYMTVNTRLPEWYSNRYSQEDRLKQSAKVSQRLQEWTQLSLEKTNELINTVNTQQEIIATLQSRIEALEDAAE